MNSKGSALLIVLMIVASAILSALIVMQSNVSISRIYAAKNAAQAADNLTQLVGTLMSDSSACFSGLQNTSGNSTNTGLKFLNASGNPSVFVPATAASSGQDVLVPTSYPKTGNTFEQLRANFQIPDAPLKVRRVYAGSPVVNKGGGLYTMKLKVDFDVTGPSGVRALSSRTLMDLRVQTGAGGVMTSCGPAPSANSNQIMCEGMNCTYTVSPTGDATCYCPTVPTTCPGGTYISAITNRVPQCTSAVSLQRSCPGVNDYLVALDNQGQAVCATVLTCPTGTSSVGAGGSAVPPECKCTTAGNVWDTVTSTCSTASTSAPTCVSGTTWNGSSCVPVASCPSGTSVTNTGGLSNVAGCKCPAGQNWGGSSCGTATPAFCPDGVTPFRQYWQTVGSSYTSNSCPVAIYGADGSIPDNCKDYAPGMLCTYNNFAYICYSSCTSATPTTCSWTLAKQKNNTSTGAATWDSGADPWYNTAWNSVRTSLNTTIPNSQYNTVFARKNSSPLATTEYGTPGPDTSPNNLGTCTSATNGDLGFQASHQGSGGGDNAVGPEWGYICNCP